MMRPLWDWCRRPRGPQPKPRGSESAWGREFRSAECKVLASRQAAGPVRHAGWPIASLNHKVGNDAVEEQTIVVALAHQFHEMVAVARCVVKQFDTNVALCCFEQHLVLHRVDRCLRLGTEATQGGEHNSYEVENAYHV